MHKIWLHVTQAFLLILLIACYRPGLYGDFEFDDQANLLQNTDIQIQDISVHSLKIAASSGESGPLGRPISMVTFALNHAIDGFDPFYLKLTNVLIHGGSATALYFLIAQLLSAYRRTYSIPIADHKFAWIAIALSATWMLHPLNLTSILYIVQRMTSLSGLFSILAIYFYTLGRNRMLERRPRGWWAILAATPTAGLIALFCKENAAVLPILLFLVEWFFFRFGTTRAIETKLLYGIFTLTAWLPLLAAALYLTTHPEWLSGGYEGRGFALSERLMTEGRVIWLYIRMIVAPDISLMGIYHDDIVLSTGMLYPASTLAAAIGLGLLVLTAAFLRNRAPMLAFGIAWFFAGHLMESSIIPLEIAHEHRNYLPMIGPLFAGVYYLLHSRITQKIQIVAYLLAALLVGMLAFSTHVRATQWGDLLEHALVEVENHPTSPRSQQQLGRMYFKLYKADPREEFYQNALKAFTSSSALDPHFKAGLYARIILDYNAGRTPPASVIADFRNRLQNRRTEPGDITMFDSLLKCQLSLDCKLPDEIFIDFLEIEVERYKGDPKRQASLLSFLGVYTAQKMDNELLAGRYLKKAVEVYPGDIQGVLNYAWYLEVIGQLDAAQAQLEIAWQLDKKLNKYGHRIYNAQQSIKNRKKNLQKVPE